MKVVYHLGLHCTDEDTALRCLLRNGSELAAAGSVISPPARFKPVLREAMIELRGARADAALQDKMKQALLDAPAERILFSNDNFVCPPARAVIGDTLYPLAAERLPWIRNLFPQDEAEFAFGLRNPVTLLPALHARFAKGEPFADYLARVDPDALSWADAIQRMRDAVPDAQLTVWCNEDSPLIWHDILAELSGSPAAGSLKGANDFFERILTASGAAKFTEYLATNPPKTRAHAQKIIAVFLDKFAREDAMHLEIDGPGWTQERVAAITARYEADLQRIQAMDGIRYIAP